jgi:nucleotide-binding universal stress UspA family protein
MLNGMKILIGYDGSECADAALDDLGRAGLPGDTQALVVAVGEIWLPTPRSYGLVDTHFTEEAPDLSEKTETLARQAANRLQIAFPNWEIKAEALIGSPARTLIEKAETWKPDLIVVGSHGLSGIKQLFFGSVSQKTLAEAHCSVRVARGRSIDPQRPVQIVVGLDGSPGADLAVEAITHRSWPAGSKVLAVGAELELPTPRSAQMMGPLWQWIHEEHERMRRSLERAKERCQSVGLSFSSHLKQGVPIEVICAEAKRVKSDCIFVGARSQSRVDRFLLGSVSAAVASRAHCSVEVVRGK